MISDIDNQVKALKLQGNAFAKEGLYQEALNCYNQVLKINPSFVEAWNNKGMMHVKLNQNDDALAAFEKALEYKPNYVKAQYHKANILFSRKQYKEAYKLYSAVLKQEAKNSKAAMGKYQCEQQIAAKVIFANVDLKFTASGEVKILEFGRGMQSGFLGLELATKKNILDYLKEIMAQLQLPNLALNSFPGSILSDDAPINAHLKSHPATDNFAPESLAHYSMLYGGYALKPVEDTILKLDAVTANLIFQDKALTHRIFMETNNLHVRPKTMQCSRYYSPELIEDINNQFPDARRLVLKVPDIEGGKGVIVVNKEDLEVTLKGMETWPASNNNYFLVEEYIASKPVFYGSNIYDATMRVVFLFFRDNGTLHLEPFACYWKLPPQPCNYSGEMREKTVSSYTETHVNSAPVDAQDQEQVYQQLRTILPAVMNCMITFPIGEVIDAEAQNTQEQKKQKATHYLHLASSCGHHGELMLAKHYLSQADQLIPEDLKYFHELGIYYHLSSDYNRAIESFTTALNKDLNHTATYYRRGISYWELGEQDKAEQDFNVAYNQSASYKHAIAQFYGLKLQTHTNPAAELPAFLRHGIFRQSNLVIDLNNNDNSEVNFTRPPI